MTLKRISSVTLSYCLLFILYFSSVADSQCHNHCSKHGSCNNEGRCECVDGFRGGDCSERVCPKGNSFSSPAYSTDLAHQLEECSSRGLCDRSTGNCQCMNGFTGVACERTSCSRNCNGNGKCLSYKQFASTSRNGDSLQYKYDSVWDAEKIYGCVCDFGYSGYDCSLEICPSGDDPLTSGGDQETQLLNCNAASGHFYLEFEGRHSTTIAATASVQDLEHSLLSIKGVGQVAVTFSHGSQLCRNDITNIVQISFNENFGPLSPLIAKSIDLNVNSSVVIGADPLTGQMIDDASVLYTPVKGSKENLECSNRGECDYHSGTCQCYDYEFSGSNGYGGSGQRGDCGHALVPITSCPHDCSFHGICDDITKVCACEEGYMGGDCSLRTCLYGKSWFSYPTDDNNGHDQLGECSDMGLCDRNGGFCVCNDGYFGGACEYMGCGPNITNPCSGHGMCLSMSQLSSYFVDMNGNESPQIYGRIPNNPLTWDANRIFGCKCDEGFEGFDCSLRSCPLGDDPNTIDNILEVCSNHGLCNYASGECECMNGWGSSDGAGGEGDLHDCGYRLPISKLPPKGVHIVQRYYHKPYQVGYPPFT